MTTFLPQNKFNSASPVADDAAASSSPHDVAAALSISDGENVSTVVGTNGVSGTEAAVSVRTAAASDLDQLADYFRRRPFIPDRAAMWDAMFDETAPRVVLDPIWADEPPLFLKAIG